MILRYEQQCQNVVTSVNTSLGTPSTVEDLITQTNPHFASNIFEKYFEGGLFSRDESLEA